MDSEATHTNGCTVTNLIISEYECLVSKYYSSQNDENHYPAMESASL